MRGRDATASPISVYQSTVKPGPLFRGILWGALIAAFISLLINLAFAAGETTPRKTFETVGGVVILVLLLVGLFTVTVSAKVTADGRVQLACLGNIRTTIRAAEVVSVREDSNFPTAGFGYRILGRMHKGFILGGPQASILLRDGRKFTVSVPSPEAFKAAIMQHRR